MTKPISYLKLNFVRTLSTCIRVLGFMKVTLMRSRIGVLCVVLVLLGGVSVAGIEKRPGTK
ncbi:MAG: hypothetical protein BMS9Abin03_147 [Thermodesulfobacteriota bacterium]|nr:MAG: hypothetical protein BMS9Abin03_147 [Thermodesulfobacteriota bacterium]